MPAFRRTSRTGSRAPSFSREAATRARHTRLTKSPSVSSEILPCGDFCLAGSRPSEPPMSGAMFQFLRFRCPDEEVPRSQDGRLREAGVLIAVLHPLVGAVF